MAWSPDVNQSPPPTFDALVDPDELRFAARRCFRGKRRRIDVASAIFDECRVLERLRRALVEGTFRPRRPEVLLVRDPKPRVIARAPLEDRLVQGALARLLEPRFLRRTVAGDLACRPGGGTHRALLRLLGALRRHRFAVHLDVRQYFPSIDTEIVERQVRTRVRDGRLCDLVAAFLVVGRGLLDGARARRFVGAPEDWPPPQRGLAIGSSLSQLIAAHLHLVELDHHVVRRQRVPVYVRYVDDLFLFGDTRGGLRTARREVERYLREELDLQLKHPEARILSCRGHLDALGSRVRRGGIEPSPRAVRRWRGRIGRYLRHDDPRETAAALGRSLVGQAGTLFFG